MNTNVRDSVERLNAKYGCPMAEFRDAIIEELCQLTNSPIAYFYATNMTEDRLTLLGYSKTVMDSCGIIDKPAMYKLEETGLWGDAIRERKPVITNDYPNLQKGSKRGYPQGHVEVSRHMNLPIFFEDRIVAIVGVGNSPDPYTMEDAETVDYLMSAVWQHFEQALWVATW